MKEKFLSAINNKLKVRIAFDTKKEGRITRLCIPFDFGRSQKDNAIDKSDKYHLWDLESPESGSHTLSINPKQIVALDVVDEIFDPGDHVKWSPSNWTYKRNWGMYS